MFEYWRLEAVTYLKWASGRGGCGIIQNYSSQCTEVGHLVAHRMLTLLQMMQMGVHLHLAISMLKGSSELASELWVGESNV